MVLQSHSLVVSTVALQQEGALGSNPGQGGACVGFLQELQFLSLSQIIKVDALTVAACCS